MTAHIAKSSLSHSAQPGSSSGPPSVGTKRPRSPPLPDVVVPFKARKVSQPSDAPSSRTLFAPAPARLPSPANSVPSENDNAGGAAGWATELLSKPQTACVTCRRPLDPVFSRWKNCEQCREKQRAYARRRKERKEAGEAAGIVQQGASASEGVRTASPDGTVDLYEEEEEEEEGSAGQRATVKAKAEAEGARSVWADVPEFQTEAALVNAARRAVLAQGTGPSARFEFWGGYAVVAGAPAVDPAVPRLLCRKLVAQGVP